MASMWADQERLSVNMTPKYLFCLLVLVLLYGQNWRFSFDFEGCILEGNLNKLQYKLTYRRCMEANQSKTGGFATTFNNFCTDHPFVVSLFNQSLWLWMTWTTTNKLYLTGQVETTSLVNWVCSQTHDHYLREECSANQQQETYAFQSLGNMFHCMSCIVWDRDGKVKFGPMVNNM